MKTKLLVIGSILIIGVIVLIFMKTQINTEQSIQTGDKVQISYTATLQDGRIFQQEMGKTITIGEDTIPGLDPYLLGKTTGDAMIIIPASESYAKFYNPTLIQRIPIYTLTQAGITAEEGEFILFGSTRYFIKNIENDIATLDSNPLHTRQDIQYTLTIHYIGDMIAE